jgi:hypothetical protein
MNFYGWTYVPLRWFLIHIVHKIARKENMKCEFKTFQFALSMLKFNLEGSLNFERVWFFWAEVSVDLKKFRQCMTQNFFMLWAVQKANLDLTIWQCCLGGVELVAWECWLGTMDLTTGPYWLCDLAKWIW